MSRVWDWVLGHWKWLLLPFWGVSVAVVWLFTHGRMPKTTTGTSDQAATSAVSGVIQAADDREQAIKKLEYQYQEKINGMSEEQKVEWEKMKSDPISDIALWIDRL